MDQVEGGGGKGRKLMPAPSCGTRCGQCETGAVTSAVGQTGLCSTAALATEVATAGVATILEVTGPLACKLTVMGELNRAEAERGTVD